MGFHSIAICVAFFAVYEVASSNLTAKIFADVPIKPEDRFFWPGATVYYSIDPTFDSNNRRDLQLAINDYHAKTCIRWIPRASQPAYVNYVKRSGGGASAENCYSGGLRTATFGDAFVGTFIHEMGHTLCFGHEQDRNDRDQYLLPGSGCSGKYNHLNGGHLYDYRSIMHYVCGSNCLQPSMSGATGCGGNNELSVLDAEKLNDMYNCPGCHGYRFRFPQLIPPNGNPVQGGTDGGLIVYPCRAYVNGHIVPGKGILSPSPACWVPNGGREIGLSTGFEILTNPGSGRMRWVPRGSGIFANAVPGGRTADGETLYIARCAHNIGGGSIYVPGNVAKNNPNVMKYSYGGLERQCATNYEFLVCE